MKKIYTKDQLFDYYFKAYQESIKLYKKWQKSDAIPLPISNISGPAGECLVYHLLKDNIIKISNIEIKLIELLGNRKTGENEDGVIGGDVVITDGMTRRQFIAEIKCYTTINGLTNKSKNNDKADYWIICNFRKIRFGEDELEILIQKNPKKNIVVDHIDGNNEDKVYLGEIEKNDDGKFVKYINLRNYLTNKDVSPILAAFSNEFFSWGPELPIVKEEIN